MQREQSEQWKPLSLCDHILVSNAGKAKNKYNNQELGYISHQYLYLSIKGKSYRLHRLIAQEFISNPDRLPVVDHIDGDKLNNSVNNLRWVSNAENVKNMHHHNPRGKSIYQIDENDHVVCEWPSVSSVAKALNKNKNTIYNYLITKKKICNHYFKYKYESNPQRNINNLDGFIPITKIICGCDFSNYSINKNDFSIINNKNNKIIKDFDHHGYRCVYLYINGSGHIKKRLLQHKLVHVIFNGGEYEDIIDHKNMNKCDNNLNNLEKVTQKENSVRATGKKVIQLDMDYNVIQTFDCINDAYKNFGKKKTSSIASVCNGFQNNKNKKKQFTERHTYLGFKWKWA